MKIWVKPGGTDRLVPRPEGGRTYFPQGVATPVELDIYIHRRLDDGDLIEVPPPATIPAGEHD